MNDYRFKLQKYKRGTKISCPKCGRKNCFVKYVDTLGEITLPDYVGRCDHEVSCQYHYTPSDYFKDNDVHIDQRRNVCKTTNPILPPRPTSYIDRELMLRTLSGYTMNPLYTFLASKFGIVETDRIFNLYSVGTSKKWGGSTVYWQIDIHDMVRTGKIMLYDAATGHRVKEPRSYVSWVHSELNMDDFNLKQCLFGEHLLRLHPDKSVALVESEKSALIATHFMPDFIWLATGGMHGCFKSEVVKVLKNREVILCPDLGASDNWRSKIPVLSGICSKVVFSQLLEEHATEEQRNQGLDIADFLLMCDTPVSILQDMIQRNPNLRLLIDTFGLELVSCTSE